jgi:hypothetical protein
MQNILRAVISGVAVAILMSPIASLAASEFEGTWKVDDTAGKPFEITLSPNGEAKANRSGEGLSGSWKQEGTTVVITWNGKGWVTKIAKEGNRYKKTAYRKGQSMDKPSDAEKVK